MIVIFEFDIEQIPELLQYFIPGYIALVLYRNITGSNKKSEHTIWISCVISYVLLLCAKLILPESAEKKLDLLVLSTCAIATIGSIVWVKIIRSNWVNEKLRDKLNYTPTSSVIESCIKLQYPGSTARIYLKDTDYYVEGTISSYSNDSDDPYIALRYYKFYQMDEAKPFYECKNEKKYFIANLSDALYIEIWETIPASEQ